MPRTRTTPKSGSPPDSVEAGTFIDENGTSLKPDSNGKSTINLVLLRLPSYLLTRVDAAVKARPGRTARHTWLLEAVNEKLAREPE